jgi:hypothetical protein
MDKACMQGVEQAPRFGGVREAFFFTIHAGGICRTAR